MDESSLHLSVAAPTVKEKQQIPVISAPGSFPVFSLLAYLLGFWRWVSLGWGWRAQQEGPSLGRVCWQSAGAGSRVSRGNLCGVDLEAQGRAGGASSSAQSGHWEVTLGVTPSRDVAIPLPAIPWLSATPLLPLVFFLIPSTGENKA